MKRIITIAAAIAALLLPTAIAGAQTPTPGVTDTVTLTAMLLTNEESALHDILFEGPGKGSPEHKAASDRYCALQAFIRLAVHYEKDGRYKVVDNPDTGTEAVVDTKTGNTMLESRDGRLVSYDISLDAKTFVFNE